MPPTWNLAKRCDEVEILTKGRFDSNRGEILPVKDRRLEIKDENGNDITRAPHNLIVKEEDTRASMADGSTESTESENRTKFEQEWGITEEVKGREFG